MCVCLFVCLFAFYGRKHFRFNCVGIVVYVVMIEMNESGSICVQCKDTDVE